MSQNFYQPGDWQRVTVSRRGPTTRVANRLARPRPTGCQEIWELEALWSKD